LRFRLHSTKRVLQEKIISTSVMLSYLELSSSINNSNTNTVLFPENYFTNHLPKSYPWPLEVASKLWCHLKVVANNTPQSSSQSSQSSQSSHSLLLPRVLASAIQYASEIESLSFPTQSTLYRLYPSGNINVNWLNTIQQINKEIITSTLDQMVATADMRQSMLHNLQSEGLSNLLAVAPRAVAIAIVHSTYFHSHLPQLEVRDLPNHLALSVANFCQTTFNTASTSSSSSTSSSTSFISSNSSMDLIQTTVEETFLVLCSDMDISCSPFARPEDKGKPKEVLRFLLTKLMTSDNNIHTTGVVMFDRILLSVNNSSNNDIWRDAPAAFLFMVSNWSSVIRDQLTKYVDGTTPETALTKLVTFIHVHMCCTEGTKGHQKLSRSGSIMMAAGWAKQASEDLIGRAIKNAPVRIVAMLQSRLKKMDGIEKDVFALTKCRFVLAKRSGSSGGNDEGKKKGRTK